MIVNDDLTKSKVLRHPDKVIVTPESLQRLNNWAHQATTHLKGKRLSRGELVNWLIESHADELSDGELVDLHAKHFDPLRALEWSLVRARELVQNGETLNLASFLSDVLHENSPKTATRKKESRRGGSAVTAPSPDEVSTSKDVGDERESL